jgi:branched chain amino acid efflux pump
MSTEVGWTLVGVVGVATMAMKGAGPVLLGGRRLPERAMRVIGLLAPAVLAALIVTQTLAGDHRFIFDARLAGMGTAVLAVLLRAPLLVVVVAAALVTALWRLLV